jgi:hypothetical protein
VTTYTAYPNHIIRSQLWDTLKLGLVTGPEGQNFLYVPKDVCITPWRWTLLEKLASCAEVHFAGPYPEPDQSSPYHPIVYLRPFLILSTHLRLGRPSGFFPSDFPTKSYMHSSSPPFVLHAPLIFFWLDHSNYPRRRAQVMKLLIMQLSPTSIYITIIIITDNNNHNIIILSVFLISTAWRVLSLQIDWLPRV